MNIPPQLIMPLIGCCLLLGSCRQEFLKMPPAATVPALSDTLFTSQLTTAEGHNITSFIRVYTGEKKELPPSDTGVQQNALWIVWDSTLYAGAYTTQGVCWLRLTVHNTSPQAYSKLFSFIDFDAVDFDWFAEKPQKTGERLSLKQWSYPSADHCTILALAPYQAKTFYIRCFKQSAGAKRPLKFYLWSELTEQAFQAYEIRSRMANIAFLLFYLGFLAFCFVYFIAQYFFHSDKKILLIYALYIFFTLLYSLRDIDQFYFFKTAFTSFKGLQNWSQAIFSYCSYIFYSFFAILLLNMKEKSSKAYKLVRAVIYATAALLVADIALRLSGNIMVAARVFATGRMVLFPSCIFYFAFMFSVTDSNYRYFLWGTIFLLLGAGVNLLIHLIRNDTSLPFHEAISSRYGFWGNPVNYTRIGVIAETLLFSLGLAKKMQVDFANSIRQEDAEIEQLYYQHEMSNGILGLKSIIHNPELVEEYLNRFDSYYRSIITLIDKSDGISLEDDLDIAEKCYYFLQLNDERLQLYVVIDKKINPDNIKLPPTIISAFIQNAKKHAFAEHSGTKEIWIQATAGKRGPVITIKDNGSGLMPKEDKTVTSSVGIQIMERRIKSFNARNNARLRFSVANRTDDRGTEVTIYNIK